MEDIKILNEVVPVMEINFEEVKASLTETMERYKNIVVTEETLKGCKETQRELAGLRRNIDTYRKEKKKVLEAPIKAFENQCKELISVVDAAEKPIKDGIAYFDDQRRAEKRAEAEVMVTEVVEEIGLNEKFAKQLTIIDKYCNLSAKKTDVKSDLTMRALALKNEQDKEAELLQIMADTLEYENQKIKNKMQLVEFEQMASRGYTTSEVITKIKQRAEQIYKIENPSTPEPVEEATAPIEEKPAPVKNTAVEEEQYFAIYRISGTVNQLKSVSEYLRNAGIVYKVEKQGRVS